MRENAATQVAHGDREAERARLLEVLRPELAAVEAEGQAHIAAFKRRWLRWAPFVFGGAAVLGGFLLSGFGVVAVVVAFGAIGLWQVSALLAWVGRARARIAAAAAPALGLVHRDRALAPIDFSTFAGSSFGQLLERAEAVNVLEGSAAGAPFMIFDARVKSPSDASPVGEMARSLALARVVRVELRGRWTGRVLILRDLGAANRLHQRPPGLDRVRLVDARFERVFEVYASDQTEARALLHPRFMERLLALEALFTNPEQPPVAAFSAGALMVAMPLFGSEANERLPVSGLARGPRDGEIELKAERLLDEVLLSKAVAEAIAGETEMRGGRPPGPQT